MIDEKEPYSITNNILQIGLALASIVGNVFELGLLELKLAGKSLGYIVGFFLLSGLFLISAWVSLMLILAFGLTACGLSTIIALLIVFILNICLLIITLWVITKYRQNLGFSETRKQINFMRGDQ